MTFTLSKMITIRQNGDSYILDDPNEIMVGCRWEFRDNHNGTWTVEYFADEYGEPESEETIEAASVLACLKYAFDTDGVSVAKV